MTTFPLVLSANQFSEQIDNPDLLIVDMSADAVFHAGHIPGAVSLAYSQIVASQPPTAGLIADDESLSQCLSEIGLSPEKHVVAYDDEGGGKAARLIFTLHAIGHFATSLLDGGLPLWQQAGGAIETDIREINATQFKARLQGTNIATRKDILAALSQSNSPEKLRLLDTRSLGEYQGTDLRAARGGHIPGAKHLEWTDLMDHSRNHAFKADDEMRGMLEARDIRPEHNVIVYCQTHHRSAHTYVALRHLGYPQVRGYPGAWSDWGNTQDTPVET